MKMKEKTKKKIRGSISVLLVIILLPMMTFSAVVVDVSRVNMAKQMMSSAGDLTMNTALANYDTILKDVYGLFAMSQAEGMDNEQLGVELNNYFAKTLSSYGIVSNEDADDYVAKLIGDFRNILNEGTIDTKNFLELSNIDLTATKVEGSSLANASVLRKQIVEYMKYRAPLGLGLSFLDSLTSFEKMDAQNTVVEAQVKAQESTQDVTKACQKLIQMIRDYDKRVEEINGALTGVTGSSDVAVIPLEDYDTHVLEYLLDWAENYTHINKLTLVFLANAPSADGVVLKELSYSSEPYVSAGGVVYSGSKSIGFAVTIDAAGDTAGAKAQIEQQIANLNNNYKSYANKYAGSMLPSDLLTLTSNNISTATISKEKENAAIDSFIKFEEFLLDQSKNGGVTYTQVKSVLEQIAILDAYRANYEEKVNADIAAAEAEKQAAESEVSTQTTNRNNAARAMEGAVTSINSLLTAFKKEQTGQLGSLFESLPTCSGSYSTYYTTNIKAGTSENKYIEAFKQQVNGSMATTGTDNQKKVIAEAKKYIEKANYNPDNFETHMKEKCDAAQEKELVFKYLCCLMKCHSQAKKYNSNLSSYNTAANKLSGAAGTVSDKTTEIERLNGEKTQTLLSVTGCLQGYHSFCNAYQADAYYYNYYINAAKNTVGPEAQKIQTHFAKLLAYLMELRDALNAIDVQIGNVKTAIANYNTNLNNWNTANTNYANANGSDSFSGQTEDDIEKAKKEYNAELYDTLDAFVIAMWNEYDTLYTKLADGTNFTYGSKRIDTIASADDLISAISGTSFSDIVTVTEATQKLTTLYKGETLATGYNPYTMDYSTPKQLGFLSPQILQIQALKYLNSAYPDESKLTAEQKKDNDATESSYNTAKDKLTGTTTESSGQESGGAQESSGEGDAAANKFGYTFDSKTTLGNLPSDLTSTDKKEFSDSEYTLTETGEGDEAKLNASESVGDQKNKSHSVLSGLGDIATAAVENLYILNYVFENFSYNTVVQEQIIEDNPLSNDSVFGQMTEADGLFGDADKVSASKKNVTTLSNYRINENNNHLFGGEVEYILFGNSNPKTNVTSAKASIYAIRFCFNCIYAFTDSTIRNSTMAAGLAVQAATLGIVPYQVVQIVLQLALAAAESAIDLSAMNKGLSIAIVKTKDTWALSMSGAKNALEDAADAALDIATDAVVGQVDSAIKNVTNGLNDLVQAGTDELEGAIEDLSANMTTAAEGVLESVVDSALTAVMTEIEEGLNGLQHIGVGQTTTDQNGKAVDVLPTKETIKAEAQNLFQNVRNNLDNIVNTACGGNEMALDIASDIKLEANELITAMETKVINAIDQAGNVDITAFIAEQMNDFKMELMEQGNRVIADLVDNISSAARDVVSESSATLQEYISRCGDDLSQVAADKIKEEVSAFADGFVEDTLKINGTNTSSVDTKGSVVSMFKFGYKDYLMLLTYISICCGDSVLVRTADVIQMNLQSAGEGAEFQHKANFGDGSFLMSKAYTYVSISATADLDMFFMDFDIFADQVAEDTPEGTETGTEVETEDGGTKITYQGLLGY